MNILLTSLYPEDARIQLALYYLKVYCKKYSAVFSNQKPVTIPPRQSEVGQGNQKRVKIDICVFHVDDKIDAIITKISKYKADIIGFSCYVWNIRKILKISREIKSKNPKVKIILGGPEVSPRATSILRNYKFIDIIVMGEGEVTFKEVVEYYCLNKPDISQINGIAYRKDLEIKITPKRAEITNLDTIPSPYLEGLINKSVIKKIKGYLPTETLRGCLFRCHYCYYHKEFESIRYFSLERVEKELKYILKKSPNGVYLMDPTFNMNRKRAKDILQIFIKHNQNSRLHVELKAEFLDREMVDLLHRAKATFIEIGIQSTNFKTLKLINRHFQPNAFKKGILLLNKKKLRYEIQLIDSLPDDNYNTIRNSIDWLMVLNPPRIKIMRLMLLPGTYLRNNARDFGIRYNHQSPYYSFESNTFKRTDLRKTKILREAITMFYDFRLLRNSIHFIKRDLNLQYSNIFEEWYKWMQSNHKGLLIGNKNGKINDSIQIKSWINTARFIKIIEKTEPFTEYLYKKYKCSNVSDDILRVVRQDKKQVLAGRGLIRTATYVR